MLRYLSLKQAGPQQSPAAVRKQHSNSVLDYFHVSERWQSVTYILTKPFTAVLIKAWFMLLSWIHKEPTPYVKQLATVVNSVHSEA